MSIFAPGEEGPERLDTTRYARAPERKKKTLTEQLDAELDSILSARPDLQLVALADGAEENWRYFDGARWKDAKKIVDIGHATAKKNKPQNRGQWHVCGDGRVLCIPSSISGKANCRLFFDALLP